MSSIFKGKRALQHQYAELTSTQIVDAEASDLESSVQLTMLNAASRLVYLDNSLNVDVRLALVHPDLPPDAANKLFWIEIGANRVLNYQTGDIPTLIFEPDTRIFLYCPVTPGSGKFRIISWG